MINTKKMRGAFNAYQSSTLDRCVVLLTCFCVNIVHLRKIKAD